MPFNGAGVYSPPGIDFPAVPNTTIESAKYNDLVNDIATALSLCLTKDGQQVVTANIPLDGFKLTGLGAGAIAGDALRYEQLFTAGAVQMLGSMEWKKGADIASAATINLTTATGNAVHVTGVAAITAVTLLSGGWRLVIFDGALTLTHHATNNNLPGGVNITTVAGDRALYWSDGVTTYCVLYQPVTVTGTGAQVKADSPTVTGTLTAAAITASGLVDISGAAAGQIKFPAAQNPSANANTLDDYEEGTWTPSVGGTATYVTQIGEYTKIGRMVFARYAMQVNVIGTGSTTDVLGLPFTSLNTNDCPWATRWSNATATAVVYLVAYVRSFATSLGHVSTAAAATSLALNATFGSATAVQAAGSYHTS